MIVNRLVILSSLALPSFASLPSHTEYYSTGWIQTSYSPSITGSGAFIANTNSPGQTVQSYLGNANSATL